MPPLDDNHTGARIREQRRLARLTQRRFADLLPHSTQALLVPRCCCSCHRQPPPMDPS
ncbi:hypothetical protein [Streptomyces sp. NBC_01235]|uniref:hypothetical protein n=1 Tax=Streptomyces sp. NBC_01235 TaxID=2903788 RepID=UPI002E116E1E|nr:hypothetical protein OG289_16745 [Streptomyces sp. NBC_01235]